MSETKTATETKVPTPQKDKGPTVHPPKPGHVKVGHIMCFTYLVKVADIKDDGTVVVNGLNEGSPKEFGVHGDSLIASSKSADQVHEEIYVTQTKAIEMLIGAGPTDLFTVHFIKNDGEPRTLKGRFIAADPRGYSNVEDLEVPTKGRTPEERWRKVDNRTIKWIIIGGVKYTVKTK